MQYASSGQPPHAETCSMPRKPRFFLPDVPAHIVQRGNNRGPIFFSETDYRAYLGWLQEAAQRRGCAIHWTEVEAHCRGHCQSCSPCSDSNPSGKAATSFK